MRFARKAALLLPVLLVAPVVNYTVDPANVFAKPGEQEAKIGVALLAGKNVVNFERYDDRAIAMYLLAHRAEHPNVLVLGSSRTLNIREDLFPHSKFVNGSMLAGTIREVLAAYGMVHRRGLHPDTVIVGIDPWMLNADAYDARWISIKPDFDSALAILGIGSWPATPRPASGRSRLTALFSGDYFQQSVKALARNGQRPEWFESPVAENAGLTRIPNGSYIYSFEQRNEDPRSSDAMAQDYIAGKIYLLNDNAHVDRTLLYAITRLLQTIRKDGSEPILYLAPYHPIVYASLAGDSRHAIVQQAEAALRETAARLGVRVVGSYDPSEVRLSNVDFYDGHHLREAGLAKIFATLRPGGNTGALQK